MVRHLSVLALSFALLNPIASYAMEGSGDPSGSDTPKKTLSTYQTFIDFVSGGSISEFLSDAQRFETTLKALSESQALADERGREKELLEKRIRELELIASGLHLSVEQQESTIESMLKTLSAKERIEKEQELRAKRLAEENREKEATIQSKEEENQKLKRLLREKDALLLQQKQVLTQDELKAQELNQLIEAKEEEIKISRQKIAQYESSLEKLTRSVEELTKAFRQNNPYHKLCDIIKDRHYSDGEALAAIIATRKEMQMDLDSIRDHYANDQDLLRDVALSVSKTTDWSQIVSRRGPDHSSISQVESQKLQQDCFRTYDFLATFYPQGTRLVRYGGSYMRPFKASETQFERNLNSSTNKLLQSMSGSSSSYTY